VVKEFLESFLGIGYEKSKTNIAFHCPFCNHRKRKLEIHPTNQTYHCWVCDVKGKSIYSLLRKMKAAPRYFEKLKEVYPKDDRTKYLLKNTSQSITQKIELPESFIPLYYKQSGFFYDKAHEYLITQRGCTELDIIKYNIGYSDSGQYKNLLIFPNYDQNGNLNFYTTRSFMNGSSTKFVNAPYDRNVIGFEMQLNWNLPLLICESALDAITLRINSTPMYGKTMSKSLKLAILENEVSEIYLCLDPDALKQQMKYIKYLLGLGIKVYHVKYPENSDVNKLGYKLSWDLINSTLPMNENSFFELEIQRGLNGI